MTSKVTIKEPEEEHVEVIIGVVNQSVSNVPSPLKSH
jgi:hypothetical protein